MAILLSPGPILRWTDVPAALQPDVENYLAVLALALPPALLFRIYSTLNQALLQLKSFAVRHKPELSYFEAAHYRPILPRCVSLKPVRYLRP